MLPAPVILSVIYAVLSRIRICRNLRVFGANSLRPNLYLCYSNRFLHLCLVVVVIFFVVVVLDVVVLVVLVFVVVVDIFVVVVVGAAKIRIRQILFNK